MWPVWETLDQRTLSNAFGAASIIFWLFAQLPQLVENYKSGSVEGLALPFLASWLAGDVTNLIGALLTDQLEFQKLLAAYFTVIDIGLVAQYIYYNARKATMPVSATGSRNSQRRRRHPSFNRETYRHLADTSRSNTMTASFVTDRSASPGTLKRMAVSRTGSSSSYHPQYSKRRRKDMREADEMQSSVDSVSFPAMDDEDTDIPKDMIESFQSEASQQSTASNRTLEALNRGRRVSRLARSAPLPPLQGSSNLSTPTMRQTSLSRDRAIANLRGHSHSKTRSVVFLSIWAFIGFTSFARFSPSSGVSLVRKSPTGTAWMAAPHSLGAIHSYAVPLHLTPHAKREGLPTYPEEPTGEVDLKRLVGRLSAWIAVIFYLTSRMPQIWKNFQRRSVEGLSILLFIAAFHGNLFYVLSILTSPLVQEEEGYLFESVPFLLGSGGTLFFDLVIMFQACIYRKRSLRAKTASSYGLDTEEAAGLLSNDEASRTSRSRNPSASRSRSRAPGTRQSPNQSQSWPTGREVSSSTALERSHSRKRSHTDVSNEQEIPFVSQASGDS